MILCNILTNANLIILQNDLISLGIVNDKDNTINLNDIMFVIDKHFFPNKNETKK